jgi:large subunit ribosomal protein L10
MNREEKSAVIEMVAEEIGAADAIFAVDYRGITVAQIAELRGKLRASDSTLRVVKNSLSERAADKAGAEALKSLLVGPTALALVKGDVASAAKILSDTARELRGPLEFKGGYMGGEALSPAQISSIAKLPSREVLYGQLVGTIAAPLNGLARGLNALIGGLAIQLGAIRDQGLVSGEAPAPAAEAAAVIEEAPAPAAEAAAVIEEAPAPAAESATEAASEEVSVEVDAAWDSDESTATAPDEAEASAATETDGNELDDSEGASDDEPSNPDA